MTWKRPGRRGRPSRAGADSSLDAGSSARPRRPLRAGAYLIPSLFTTANMLLGFYALLAGLEGQFRAAVLMIFAAAVLDTLDGRIARLTGTASPFGREYDSLADLVSFGLAPALLCYLWGLDELGRVGFAAPAVYLLCSAARLARFNVSRRTTDPRYFIGLPAPAAAGAIGSILFFVDTRGDSFVLQLAVLGALVLVGLLSVSTFRYLSFKEIDFRRRRGFRVVVVIAAITVLALIHIGLFFLVGAASYALSGPTAWLGRRLRRRGRTGRTEAEAATGPGP